MLAYNVGNEVIIALNTTNATPFIKAAARDIKAYLWVTSNILHFCLSSDFRLSIGSTALVGYAAIDGTQDFILPVAEMLSCDPSGTNSGSTSIDLYGLND